MKITRTLPALGALLAVTGALAHPGHPAPPLHAHDLDEATVLVAILLVAAVGSAVAWVLHRRRDAAARVRADDDAGS